MHELSIVSNIVQIADEEVRKAKAREVDRITLSFGECSGIERAAFEFAWPIAVKDTVLEHAEKRINTTPGLARCLDCGHTYDLHDYYDPCPECGCFVKDILSGRELIIESITVN